MVYEYKCDDCGEVTEWRFPMGEAPSAWPCLHCWNDARRLFTALAVHYPAKRHDKEMDNLDRDLYYANKASKAPR